MDRRRPRTLRRPRPPIRSGLTATVAVLTVLLGGAALGVPPTSVPLRAGRWLAAGVDPVHVLTHQPAECLAAAPHRPPDDRVEIGRAAFRTPLLLGGQASRAGLACESCHINGRGNSNFFFPGLSGPPGTADVTSALFSTVRDDGVDNPKPIPDLGGDKRRLKIEQSGDGAALRAFIRGLVVEEFAGAEPPPAVLDGLAAYVRALDPKVCAGRGEERLHASLTLSDAARAGRAALRALETGDLPTAVLMIEAARSRLGQLDERYAAPGLAADRAAILASARDLSLVLSRIRSSDPGAVTALTEWLSALPRLTTRLQHDEPLSLYAEGPLRDAIGALEKPAPNHEGAP